MKIRIALALILLGLSSQAFAVATFGAVSLSVDATRFHFDVVVGDAGPGAAYQGGNSLRKNS